MFSCEICEVFKNTYFEEQLWTTASDENHCFWFFRSLYYEILHGKKILEPTQWLILHLIYN